MVYPPYCIFCQRLLSDGKESICDPCWDALPPFPRDHNILIEIKEKLNIPVYIADVKTLWQFKDNVQFVIHRLKYKHHKFLARKIAYYITNLIIFENKIDLLIPVPLHKKRKRIRGYNQSTLICKAVSRVTNIPVNETSLIRIKNTISQTTLNIIQRQNNVANAFQVVRKKEITGQAILLIDDVITTGSTINACAQQLKLNGANEVFAVSIAKA